MTPSPPAPLPRRLYLSVGRAGRPPPQLSDAVIEFGARVAQREMVLFFFRDQADCPQALPKLKLQASRQRQRHCTHQVGSRPAPLSQGFELRSCPTFSVRVAAGATAPPTVDHGAAASPTGAVAPPVSTDHTQRADVGEYSSVGDAAYNAADYGAAVQDEGAASGDLQQQQQQQSQQPLLGEDVITLPDAPGGRVPCPG